MMIVLAVGSLLLTPGAAAADQQSRSDLPTWSPAVSAALVPTLLPSTLGARGTLRGAALFGTTQECDGLEPTRTGTEEDDTLTGTPSDDVILGLGGNDTIMALEGNDIVCSGAGNDVIDLGPGAWNIAYSGEGDDEITGGSGQDQISPGPGEDVAHGGSNPDGYLDSITYLWAPRGVSVDLGAGEAEGEGHDAFDGIEAVDGSMHADVLLGDDQLNILNGGGYTLFTGEPQFDESDDVIDSGDNLDPRFLEGLYGQGGNDRIRGGAGAQELFGQAGNDELWGGEGDDRLSGDGLELDCVVPDAKAGPRGNDVLIGGAGADLLCGGRGNDRLRGGADQDQLYPGEGIDFVNGGSSGGGFTADTLAFFDAAGPVSVNLSLGIANGQGRDRIKGVEAVFGSPYGDRLVGDAKNNQLWAGLSPEGTFDSADDELLGMGGDFDVLIGHGGDDMLDGGDGIADRAGFLFSLDPVDVNLRTGRATGEGQDRLKNIEVVDGSFFDDVLVGDRYPNFFNGNLGDDEIRGGAGNDFVSFDQSYVLFSTARSFIAQVLGINATFSPIRADLATGSASGEGTDTLDSIELLTGGPLDDELIGSDENDGLFGGDGNDVLSGGGGNDLLMGEGGNDQIDGGDGFYDVASFRLAIASISASLQTGRADGDGDDSLSRIEGLEGSIFPDELWGDDLVNYLFGTGGNDVLHGVDGDDFLSGGIANDSLDGEAGNDNCSSGETVSGCEGDEPPPPHPLNDVLKLLEGRRHH